MKRYILYTALILTLAVAAAWTTIPKFEEAIILDRSWANLIKSAVAILILVLTKRVATLDEPVFREIAIIFIAVMFFYAYSNSDYPVFYITVFLLGIVIGHQAREKKIKQALDEHKSRIRELETKLSNERPSQDQPIIQTKPIGIFSNEPKIVKVNRSQDEITCPICNSRQNSDRVICIMCGATFIEQDQESSC